MKQPLDSYPAILMGVPKREREIRNLSKTQQDNRRNSDYYAIVQAGTTLVNRFTEAMEHMDEDQEVVIAEKYVRVFVELYERFMSSGHLLWAEHDQEARRLTPALLQYYNWLSTLPKLTEDRLHLFQRIDDVLRLRVAYLTSSALACADKIELQSIADALNIQLVKRYTQFIPGEAAVYHDGWHGE